MLRPLPGVLAQRHRSRIWRRAGKVDDIWGALQNSKEGTDVLPLLKELPFSRLPFIVPFMNALRKDD